MTPTRLTDMMQPEPRSATMTGTSSPGVAPMGICICGSSICGEVDGLICEPETLASGAMSYGCTRDASEPTPPYLLSKLMRKALL